jgi:hypothetical protein
MKLLVGYIENFGKLSDLTINFSDKIHFINEQNGWGKSTLATFIKVMFFGFENETKRNVLENERKKYTPWQRGVYGGQITFQTADKTYTIMRTFGSKEKEDTFTLYDTKTNLESNDYSTHIGEELFKIDQESFNRTVYIGQNTVYTNSTDSINAKIGNLTENTDDINNYEAVQNRFAELLNSLSPKRKTGLIKRTEEEIGRLEMRIREGSTIDSAINSLNQKLIDAKEKREILKIEQTEIHAKLQQILSYQNIKVAKEKYDWLCAQYQKALENKNDMEHIFPKQIPKSTQVQKILEDANQLTSYQSTMNIYKITDSQTETLNLLTQQFNQKIPDDEIMAQYKEKAQCYSDLQLEKAAQKLSIEEENTLSKLKVLFEDGRPDEKEIDQYINSWNQRTTKKSALAPKRVALNTLKNISDLTTAQSANKFDSQKLAILLVLGLLGIFGIATILAGVNLLTHPRLGSSGGIILISIGILFILTSFIFRPKGLSGNTNMQNNVDNHIQNDDPETKQEWQTLEEEIQADEKFIQDMEQNVRQFIVKYNLQYDEHTVIPNLYELKNNVQEFEKLSTSKQRHDAKKSENTDKTLEIELKDFLSIYFSAETISSNNYLSYLQKLEQSIEEYRTIQAQINNFNKAKSFFDLFHSKIINFIEELGFEAEENLTNQLHKLQNDIHSLTFSKDAVRTAQLEKEDFEKEYPVEIFKELQLPKDFESADKLTIRHSEITPLLEQTVENIANYVKQIDDLQSQRADISDDEDALELLKQENKQLEHRHDILIHAKDLLEKSKENFTTRYMKPVMKGFDKYYKILTKQHANNYKIDANIMISATEQGEQRDIKFLSVGYQDLINICMRMALVDAMYQNEKPFIIVDDSFVNLDNKKVQGGLNFLDEISKEYQVIYFTCHDSREKREKVK